MKALRVASLWWQVDSMEEVLELCGFVDSLLQGLVQVTKERWRTESSGLLLQLLCACQRCLSLNGDCRLLLRLMQQLLPSCQQVRHLSLLFLASLYGYQYLTEELTLTVILVRYMTFNILCRICHWMNWWWVWPCSFSKPLQPSRAACLVWVNILLKKLSVIGMLKQILDTQSYECDIYKRLNNMFYSGSVLILIINY